MNVRPVFPFLMLLCSHFSVVTNIVRHHPRGLSAFSPMPRKLLDISQDNRRILDCLSFLVEKKEEKKRKKVTYFYSPSIPSLFSFGPIWHRVIEVVCCSILHALPRKKSKKKPRAIPDSGNWESSFRTSKA